MISAGSDVKVKVKNSKPTFNMAPVRLLAMIGVLVAFVLHPAVCGWADMLRTTTPTTPNPDKPGKRRQHCRLTF